jgi:hypothetical protein
VRTVLGLSKTSTSIGWVLVDEEDVAGEPLDHDAFDITDASAVAPAATARRVRDIATATGHTVDSVHVTTSGNPSSLRDGLMESGFSDVVCVSLTEATRAWAIDTGRSNSQQKPAVCVLGRDSASLSVIDTFSGATQYATTTTSGDATSLIQWLATTFGVWDELPDVLYLIGPRCRLDEVTDPLDKSLWMPVVASHDAQLALARGAACASRSHIEQHVVDRRSGFAPRPRTLAVVVAVTVVSLLALSSAGRPILLTQNDVRQSATAPETPRDSVPSAIASVAPPPQAQAPRPVPDALAPESMAAHPAVGRSAAEAVPPADHIPDMQPVQHLPEAATPAAPGPAAPIPGEPVPPLSTPDPVDEVGTTVDGLP